MNNVTEVPTCCYVNAIRTFEVEKLKGGSIEVVDYYDTCEYQQFCGDFSNGRRLNQRFFFQPKKLRFRIRSPSYLTVNKNQPGIAPDDMNKHKRRVIISLCHNLFARTNRP